MITAISRFASKRSVTLVLAGVAVSSLLNSATQISAYALDKRELENARTTASALESLNDQLQKKLQVQNLLKIRKRF